MDNKISVKVDGISKKFSRTLKRSMLYGISDIAKNSIGLQSKSGSLRKNEFWAVDNISFELNKGETLGLIGPNGSGKSTILKMLNGIYWPDKGKIEINGKVGALIEVGAGFHPMLTGRENIYINAAILGMTKEEVESKFDDIVKFADIGDFLDSPVKFYSSGMFVRLGFAVAVHCEPDILLVDEVLAVGDIEFQAKCFNKIGEMKKNEELTVILVSHHLHKIVNFSDKVLYIDQSKMKYLGDVKTAIDKYNRDIDDKFTAASSEFMKEEVKGSGEIRTIKAEFIDHNGKIVDEIDSGDSILFRIHYSAERDIDEMEIVLQVSSGMEDFFIGTNKAFDSELNIKKGTGHIDILVSNLNINSPRALFSFSIWSKGKNELYDAKHNFPLSVRTKTLTQGKITLETEWRIKAD